LIKARAKAWIATGTRDEEAGQVQMTRVTPNPRRYTNSGCEIRVIAFELEETKHFDRNTTDCLAMRMVEAARKSDSEMGHLITEYRKLHKQYPSRQEEETDETRQLKLEIVTRMDNIATRLHELNLSSDAIDGITRY